MDGVLIKGFVLKNFRNVIYAAQRRAWTTDHTLCNGAQMGPLPVLLLLCCALSDRGGFTAMNRVYVTVVVEEKTDLEYCCLQMENRNLNFKIQN